MSNLRLENLILSCLIHWLFLCLQNMHSIQVAIDVNFCNDNSEKQSLSSVAMYRSICIYNFLSIYLLFYLFVYLTVCLPSIYHLCLSDIQIDRQTIPSTFLCCLSIYICLSIYLYLRLSIYLLFTLCSNKFTVCYQKTDKQMTSGQTKGSQLAIVDHSQTVILRTQLTHH